MSQALTIRFGTDVESARKGVASLAGSIAGNMVKITQSMQSAGRTIDGTLASTVARTAASVAALQLALAGGTLAAFAILTVAVNQASAELDRFVKLGEQAGKLGLDVESYQRFSQALGGDKEAIEALGKAIDTVKPKFEELGKVRELLGRLFESGYTGNFVSQGLKQFDTAADDKGRVQAVIVALKELKDLGLGLEAVKLGDTLFGPEIAERIRNGKLDIDDMLAKLAEASGKDIITQDQVDKATELNDRIEKAKDAIAEGVHVSISLEKAGRAVLEVWASILETVAKAFAGMNAFVNGIKAAQQSTTERTILSLEAQLPGAAGPEIDRIRRRIAEERAKLAAADGPNILPTGPMPPAQGLDSDVVTAPLPVRPPTDITELRDKLNQKPARGGSTSDSLDRVESFINALERSRDVLKAELDNLGKSNVEREKAIELAKAEAAARSAGRSLTDAERTKVLELAAAQSQLKDRILDVKQAQQQAAETARYFGDIASDALGSLIFDGAKAQDVLKNLVSQLGKAAIQAVLLGSGPLAGVFGTAPLASAGSNAVGGLVGAIAGGFKAGGGDVRAGRAYTVGELGRELFVPDSDGSVIPIRSGGGASRGNAITLAPSYAIDARGSQMSEAQFRSILAQNNARLKAEMPGYLVKVQQRGGA